MATGAYCPIDGETLAWIVAGESVEDQAYIRQQVEAANVGEIRNYSVILSTGTNYQISPGFVNASKGGHR